MTVKQTGHFDSLKHGQRMWQERVALRFKKAFVIVIILK
jgi:hypothetical protein